MTADVIILTCVPDVFISRTIGPYAIAHAARLAGYSAQVIDFTDYFTEDELFNTITKFIGDNTRVVGVSSTFYQTEVPEPGTLWLDKNTIIGLPKNILNNISRLKKLHPKIKFVLGGSNSGRHEEWPDFDVVFHSYSDTSFLEYLKDQYRIWPRINNRVVIEGENFPVDVEHLTHKWADNDHIFHGESLPIEISRGCIFKCKFCNFQLTGKSKLDHIRNAQIVKEQLEYNYEKFGTTNYTFADDTFNDSMYKLEELHKVITQLPFKINFTTYLRLDLIYKHRDQIPLLKEMGIASGFFGIESYNPKTAKAIGKGLDSSKVKEFLLEIKNEHFKDNFTMVCSFILGLPYESIDSMRSTFEWNQANKINSLYLPLFITPTLRYKSDLDINYEKYGYTMDEHGKWFNEHTNYYDARDLAREFTAKTNNTIHTWPMFALASLGVVPLEQLHGTWADPNNPLTAYYQQLIRKKTIERIAEYKRRLNE